MNIKIVFHPSGDWEALYIEGVLQAEGHSIRIDDLVEGMNNTCNTGKFDFDLTIFSYDTRDLGNEEGFDEDYDFPLKYEDIDGE